MKFAPGKSGNPGGRPRVVAEIQLLARNHTADALKTLAEIMKNPKVSPAARVSAACALLDRGYGKPAQESTVTIDDKRSAADWTRDELVAFLNDARTGRKGAAHGGRATE